MMGAADLPNYKGALYHTYSNLEEGGGCLVKKE